MTQLSQENFVKAKEYILAHGDEIGRAWLRYHFEGENAREFLDVLAKYQQENGGFGGLYYEYDYHGVCLKSTEIAIRYILNMRELPAADHPIVKNLMRYLLDNYLPGIGNWGEVVVPEVNEGTHCYWVRFEGEDTAPIANKDERVKRYDANQKACFAAFVACYPELMPEDLYREILWYPTEHILRYWDVDSPEYNEEIFEKGEPYDFEYFQDFVLCLKDEKLKEKLTGILRQNPTAFMELDLEKSNYDYVHLPCDSIKRPDSVVYPAVKELVDKALGYRIRQQWEDGRWPLGWSFGEEEKLQALQEKYETYLSLLMLVKLKQFGRIEGI